MKRAILATSLLLGATAASATDRPRFDADDTLRRARVGIYSERLAPPVRVTLVPPLGESARIDAKRSTRRQIQQQFERMDCRVRESTDSIVCVPFPP